MSSKPDKSKRSDLYDIGSRIKNKVDGEPFPEDKKVLEDLKRRVEEQRAKS